MINISNYFFKKYYHFIDQFDAKVGRRAAIILDVLAPCIFSQIVFAPGLLLHAYNIQKKLITVPLIALETIAYLRTILRFQKTKNIYRKDEIKQIIVESRRNSKKALIIEATDWSGGAPSPDVFESTLLSSTGGIQETPYRFNLLQLAKTHSIQHLFAHSESELNENLDHLQNNTIDLVWIRGHGNQEGVYFNQDFFFNKASTSIKKIAEKLQQSASCILSSCRTGYGESNIAKTLSASFSNTMVYAPQGIISSAYQAFTTNLFPIFYSLSGWKKVMTRSYYAGAESIPN